MQPTTIVTRAALLMTVILLAACRSQPEPPPGQTHHKMLQSLKPPPVNLPPGPIQIPQGSPALPPGKTPALLAVSGGAPFRGEVTINGSRITVGSDRIDVTGGGSSGLTLLYRLPSGLTLAPRTVMGDVRVLEQSSPAGPQTQVVITANGGPLFAYAWVTSREVISADLGGVRFLQRGTTADGPSPRTPLTILAAYRDGALEQLTIAKPTPLKTATGSLQVLVEASHAGYTSDGSGKRQARYVLRAWVVPG